MEIKELKKLLELLKDSNVSEFEMEREGVKLKISRIKKGEFTPQASQGAAVPPNYTTQTISSIPEVEHTPAAKPPAVAEEKKSEEDFASQEDVHIISSPIVGTFYRRPNPKADPYVEVGDRVKNGQILCIVEAMKLMNEITTDVSGEVVKIFIEDAKPVEYGEALFAIKTA